MNDIFKTQHLVSKLLPGIGLNNGSGSSLKIWRKVAYRFDILSQVDPIWNIMKFGPQEVLRVGAFSEEVRASFEWYLVNLCMG